MDNLILVNKTHSIGVNYVPTDLVACNKEQNVKMNYVAYLREEAYQNAMDLRKHAKSNDYDIYVYSGFRSGAHQQRVFENFLEQYTKELIQKYPSESLEEIKKQAYLLTTRHVARPGYSEHQTGLAMDIACFYKGNYNEDISNIGEIEWMHDNAHKYGFILRYPEGFEEITGYKFEPWHYRYIGEEHATKVVKKGLVYEDYYSKILGLK